MTTNLQANVHDILSEFSQRLIEAFASSFAEFAGSSGRAAAASSAPSGKPAGKRRGRPPKAAAAPAAPRARGGRGKIGSAADGRRLPRETAEHATRFVEYVKAHPGQRIREIGAALKMSTKDLALPVAKALKTGAVTKSGQRSATAYFPSDGGGAAPAKGRRGKKKG